MSDQKSTPGAGFPPPEKESTPGAFPDLSAHSDSPAWLSEDGNHDAGVWERSFEGAVSGEPAGVEEADGAGSAVNAPSTDAGTEGDGTAALELPPEPVVVAPEELKLEEPSLAEPTLSDDAVEAAALDQVASETAAAEATAAEAGRLSGLEPAPAGTEVQVDANAAGVNESGETGEATALSGPTPEDGEATASDPDSAAGTASEGSAETDAATDDGAGDGAATDSAESPTADSAEAVDSEAGSTATEGGSEADDAEDETVPDSPADADESKADSAEDETASKSETPEPVEEREPVGEAEHEPSQGDAEPHPLHGINAAAPMTTAHQERTPAPVAAAGEPEPVTAAVPAGDTRRSRRLAESRTAGATAAFKQPGASYGTTDPATGAGTASAPATVKDSGKSKRNTRLILVLGGVVLAAVVAILLFVFVFNGKAEGVISEDVSPLELEDGACLKDWDDVNSSATVVTCETPHNAQLVATDSFTEDAAFPGTSALEERVNDVCEAVQYAGAAAEFPGLKLAKSIPTEQTWASGDRRVDCIVFAPEGQELTESLVQE
ncbi:septum formation family protein [Arthrobacter sp. zg-Y179]|uniref:septum formation family protein n=1 Tax=Arthrobacter sp. zg-Y179 TaxID=2894188 RepID=UPI001E407E4F|nr:septum formation family protein [Arthrobacter sp. zg-Y179]MCC9173567.1 septum formation family protein [Arthrobacter sp. zg-Y179]